MADEEQPQVEETPVAAPTPPPPTPPLAAAAAAGNGFSIASLVLGIVGLVLTITFVVGLICDVLAVVFGALGRTKAREAGSPHTASLATAGMILGLVGLGLLLLLLVLVRSTGFHVWHFSRFHRMMLRR